MKSIGNLPDNQNVDKAFNNVAQQYDDWIQNALPGYDEIFSTAVELIPFDRQRKIEVLDLGAGTGLFSQHVLEAYPKANFVLIDLAEEMLGIARNRFANSSNSLEFIRGDLTQLDYSARFDLVISSLAIHHLSHEGKQKVFKRIFDALRSGGAFINVDQIRGEGRFEEIYWNTWLDKVRATDAAENMILKSIERRRKFDQDATLSDQIAWLRAAGFQADCVYKNYFVGVFLALKPKKSANTSTEHQS